MMHVQFGLQIIGEMTKVFMLHIRFRRALNGPEQNAFWIQTSNCLQQVGAFGCGGQDVFSLQWEIDYSQSALQEFAIKKHIAQFLEHQPELIKDYYFYKHIV